MGHDLSPDSSRSPSQCPVSQPGGSRLLFDGGCGFCSAWAAWGRARLSLGVPIVAWQQEADTLPETVVAMAQDAVVFMDGDHPTATGAGAVALLLGTSAQFPVRVLGVILRLPFVCTMSAVFYRWVARNRYRWSGPAIDR